jgi:hypothetical protein
VLRLLLCASLATASFAAREDPGGEIDWQRRVVTATGQGAPDLNAPSIAVARLAAERAAIAAAQRNALETLSAAPLESGGTVGALLQTDAALRSKLQGKLKGIRPVKTHYFSDGGISLRVEVPFDQLPPEIGQKLKPPEAQPSPDAGTPAPAPGGK